MSWKMNDKRIYANVNVGDYFYAKGCGICRVIRVKNSRGIVISVDDYGNEIYCADSIIDLLQMHRRHGEIYQVRPVVVNGSGDIIFE